VFDKVISYPELDFSVVFEGLHYMQHFTEQGFHGYL